MGILKMNSNISHSRRICQTRAETTTSLQRCIAMTKSLALASIVYLSQPITAVASEFDILADDEPKTSYYMDDASVLSRNSRDLINNRLRDLENRTGYRLTVITTRKLEFEPDAISYSEKIFNKWHKSDGGDKSGLLLVVTAGKDGALIGGKSLEKALGEELIDSIVGDNIPIFTDEEKFNEAALSSIERISATLDGKNDPGPPRRAENSRKRTYKTKEETDRVKPVTGTIVITLLVIAFVVPMLQFYGYVSKD